MFKMGCSMARKILGPGSGSSSNEQMAASSAAGGARGEGGEKNGKQANKSADELGDFSKLEDDPRLPLNVRQIFKITKSWKAIARTMSKTGTAMFLNLFEQNQDLFYLFDRFQHLKGKELHESMELREHAATVMATLDQSINSLSDYDNFVSYLHSIGQLHRKVPGFKREYFWKIEQPFMKAVKQTLDERCNETIEQIYVIAIKLIIETIAEGYGQDDDSVATKRDFEAKTGGGGAGAGTEAGGEFGERTVRDEKKGERNVGAGHKGAAQQERTNCNENNRAKQHSSSQQASNQTALGCPYSCKSTTDKQISEKKSISAEGREVEAAAAAANSSEQETSLEEATRELMKSTAILLSETGRGHEATRVQWQRLMNELSGTNGSLLESSEESVEEVQLASQMTSNESDRRKPDSRKWAAAKRKAPQDTQETTGCPRTPATQYKSSSAASRAAAAAKQHQIIISSSPPAACCSPLLNKSRLDLAQHGASNQVQGLAGLNGAAAAAAAAEDNAAPMGRSSVVTSDCLGQASGNIAAHKQSQQQQQSAMMSSCNNNNNELVRSQVTNCELPNWARVTLQPEVSGESAEGADLIKSTSTTTTPAPTRLGRLASWRAKLNRTAKLTPPTRLQLAVAGAAGWLNTARSTNSLGRKLLTSNQNQSDTSRSGRLYCARQSQNNNKLQITPHSASPKAPRAAANEAPSAAEIRLEAHSRAQLECKQAKRPAAKSIVDHRPPTNGPQRELRGAATKFDAMLHKSESAVSKLLAKAQDHHQHGDAQLAELIKVLLLINRLLLTLASRPQRQWAPLISSSSSSSSNAEATRAQSPLFVAS